MNAHFNRLVTQWIKLCILVLLCISCQHADAVVVYVDSAAKGTNNGTSWVNAFTSIQAGIDAASANGGGEVWVKKGTYTGTRSDVPGDSFEALNQNAVDVVGEEEDFYYTVSGSIKHNHLTVIQLTGNTTVSPPQVTFGNTTQQDSFIARMNGMANSRNDIIVFANHPSEGMIDSTSINEIKKEDLLAAANSGALLAMEIKNTIDEASWDYVLANLDDQNGDCTRILWGIYADDQHRAANIDFTKYPSMIGAIPTVAQDPVYADRRTALKDMLHRGSFMNLAANSKCGLPVYKLNRSSGTADSLQIDISVGSMPGATGARLSFFGCDSATGSIPGTLLLSKPVTFNSNNSIIYYLTSNGAATGTPLSIAEKANIKYVRPVLIWTISGDERRAYLEPVRIRKNGDWWNGPAYTLAGHQATINGSPYPAGGSDTAETVYFNTHSHTTASDGDDTPSTVRRMYWEKLGYNDPTKPRFTIITDHNTRTPFVTTSQNVLTLKEGVYVYGGFSGSETNRNQRNPITNPTVVDGQNTRRCIYIDGSSWQNKTNAALDGLTITGGRASSGGGGGIVILRCSPTINNCVISNNYAFHAGAGILATQSSPTISNCSFSNNTTTSTWGSAGAGIDCELNSDADINKCTFTKNTASRGGALYISNSLTKITQCMISSNTAIGNFLGGGALYNAHSSSITANNVICRNNASLNSGLGGGIFNESGSNIQIINNTFISNTASAGGAIHWQNSNPTIENNIIAFNSSGLRCTDNKSAIVRNNCVYNNNQGNYSGLNAGTADISADPCFLNMTKDDYHLTQESPCINKGYDAAVQSSWRDMDDLTRIRSLHVDMGAYEMDGIQAVAAPSFSPPGGTYRTAQTIKISCTTINATIHYTTNGVDPTENDPIIASGGSISISTKTTLKVRAWKQDYIPSDVVSATYLIRPPGPVYVDCDSAGTVHDGQTWQTAFKSIQAAIDECLSDNQIWVAAGTYVERITLKAGVPVLGGFSGTETDVNQRDWRKNRCIIDADKAGSVVTIPSGCNNSKIDGFTIKNGLFASGGGIFCAATSAIIENNIISDNSAVNNGGGVYLIQSNATVCNNLIIKNTSSSGAGVYEDRSTPILTNNTICDNIASVKGAIYCTKSNGSIVNNIIGFNSAGIYNTDGIGPMLDNNCVFGNQNLSYSGIQSGQHDIEFDPKFTDRINADYHINSDSPCIDAGTMNVYGKGSYDMDLCPRVFGKTIDIGADEYWPCDTYGIQNAKLSGDNSTVNINGAVVTAAFSGFFYIESDNRILGIRVAKAGYVTTIGNRIDVRGVMKTTDAGERYVEATEITPKSSSGDIHPFFVNNRQLCGGDWFYNLNTGAGQQGVFRGRGTTTIGLLVRVCGRVVSTGQGCVIIDDGAGANIKVITTSQIQPTDLYLQVTGVSSCYKDGGILRPEILTRNTTDVIILNHK